MARDAADRPEDSAGGGMPAAVQLQVAFAGHNRAPDLGEPRALTRQLDNALRLLKQAGVGHARLVTGLADGADLLAAKAWRRAKLGPIHGVLPFIEADVARPAQSATWLDGAATRRAGRNPHLAQTRWLLNGADLLIVVWTGAEARGAGGTADAVRLAWEQGLPILWLKPGHPEPRLLRAPGGPHDGFLELLEALRAKRDPTAGDTAEALRAIVATATAAPPEEPSATARARRLDAWLHRWLWRTFALFQRIVGGHRRAAEPPALPPPADLVAQPGFKLLTEAYEAADGRATRLASVHRSEQILLLLAAVAASAVGASPAIWPDIKLSSVLVEQALGVAALAVWWTASRARRHQRWTQARRNAEQLRLERAGWVLGVSPQPPEPVAEGHAPGARSMFRQAPPPAGRFDHARREAWSAWAIDELIVGQARYHRQQAQTNHRIAHRVHQTENISFGLLLAALAAYAVGWVAATTRGLELQHWVAGVVLMAGVIVPALGAAGMALEAKLQFEDQAQRSGVLARRLDDLAASLGEKPDLHAVQRAARTAMGWLSAEADVWRDGAERRRLFRGG